MGIRGREGKERGCAEGVAWREGAVGRWSGNRRRNLRLPVLSPLCSWLCMEQEVVTLVFLASYESIRGVHGFAWNKRL